MSYYEQGTGSRRVGESVRVLLQEGGALVREKKGSEVMMSILYSSCVDSPFCSHVG